MGKDKEIKKNLRYLSLNDQFTFQEIKVSLCSYTLAQELDKSLKPQCHNCPDVPHSARQRGKQAQDVR